MTHFFQTTLAAFVLTCLFDAPAESEAQSDECLDLDWRTSIGVTCASFVRNTAFCEQSSDVDENGIFAIQACCACGGGRAISGDCGDDPAHAADCPTWANANQCIENSDVMEVLCPASCGLCDTPETGAQGNSGGTDTPNLPCSNRANWVDDISNSCASYEVSPSLCNVADILTSLDPNSVSAKEACCVCKPPSCIDFPGFRNLYGLECVSFNEFPHLCITIGADANADGSSAVNSCCVCQQTCEDDLEWQDKNGFGCTVYSKAPYLCSLGDSSLSTNGIHASQACCICEESLLPTSLPTLSPIPSPTSQPTTLPTAAPTECSDNLQWRDSNGFGCDIYSRGPNLCEFANNFAANSISAVQACCICKESLPTPTVPPSPPPTKVPTTPPSSIPTKKITLQPTVPPTHIPTNRPSSTPTLSPTNIPTSIPTTPPTTQPTAHPTRAPSSSPTPKPTFLPTNPPTRPPALTLTLPPRPPTKPPTRLPTRTPTERPTESPTKPPTQSPTQPPTQFPTEHPTQDPAERPTENPTEHPTHQPTETPSHPQTESPTEEDEGTTTVVPFWDHLPMHWCTLYGRQNIAENYTMQECKAACLVPCKAIEWWEAGTNHCFECVDPNLAQEYLWESDTAYPPHVYLKGDNCADSTTWFSEFGNCLSYRIQSNNYEFCAIDYGKGEDHDLFAVDACPKACGLC